MGSIMLVRGLRVVTRAATVGYTAGRHRRPPATAPVVVGFTAEELAAARTALYGTEGSDAVRA